MSLTDLCVRDCCRTEQIRNVSPLLHMILNMRNDIKYAVSGKHRKISLIMLLIVNHHFLNTGQDMIRLDFYHHHRKPP